MLLCKLQLMEQLNQELTTEKRALAQHFKSRQKELIDNRTQIQK